MPLLEQTFSRPTLYFSANHLLVGYGKCDRLHGHDYILKVKITYQSANPDETLDFRRVNMLFKQIITKLDHKILLPEGSKYLRIESALAGKNWLVKFREKSYSFPKKDVLILKGMGQATTENLAIYIHRMLREKIKSEEYNKNIMKITVYLSETIGNEVAYTESINSS